MHTRSSHRIAAIAVGLMLALSACGADTKDSNGLKANADGTSKSDASSSNQQKSELPKTPLEQSTKTSAALSAIETALKQEGGTAFEIEQADAGWEVHVLKDKRAVTVIVDPAGASVVGTRRDERVSRGLAEALEETRIPLSRAITVAAKRVSGDLDDAELDTGRHQNMWVVTLVDKKVETDVFIDISNGLILRYDRD